MSSAELDVATRFAAEHPGDAARRLEGLGRDDAAAFLAAIPAPSAAGRIPMLLTALRQDPAQSSSIILTTVTDVVGFFSFLGIATLLAGML